MTWLFHVHCWTLLDFSFLLSVTFQRFNQPFTQNYHLAVPSLHRLAVTIFWQSKSISISFNIKTLHIGCNFAETTLHSCGLNHWWYHTEAVMHKVAQVFLPKDPDELSFHFRKRVWLEPQHLQMVCLKLIPCLADDVTSLRLNDSWLNSSRRYSCFAFLTVTTHH